MNLSPSALQIGQAPCALFFKPPPDPSPTRQSPSSSAQTPSRRPHQMPTPIGSLLTVFLKNNRPSGPSPVKLDSCRKIVAVRLIERSGPRTSNFGTASNAAAASAPCREVELYRPRCRAATRRAAAALELPLGLCARPAPPTQPCEARQPYVTGSQQRPVVPHTTRMPRQRAPCWRGASLAPVSRLRRYESSTDTTVHPCVYLFCTRAAA